MLYRNITDQIIADLSYFPVIGIIGPRQVGKTTLAKYILTKINGGTIYLDLELNSDRNRLSDPEIFLNFHQDKCVVLDEIQQMPELFSLLRALVDQDRRPGRFILLGSASPSLIKDSAETLAGRIAYNELCPLSWQEIQLKFTMQDHWLKGGFPESILAPQASLTNRWLNMFIDTFIYRDLTPLNYNLSSQLASKLLLLIASINGSILNISDLSRSLGISQSIVNNYLNILEGGFITRRLQPYFINISKRIVKSPKLYIRDSGILHAMLNITDYTQLLDHPIIGASWEGYVIEQIQIAAPTGSKLYFYRTHKGAEIDLIIITPNMKKIALEIKFSSNPKVSRGFYEATQDISSDHNFIIIPNGDEYPKNNDVIVCNLSDFLARINYLCDSL